MKIKNDVINPIIAGFFAKSSLNLSENSMKNITDFCYDLEKKFPKGRIRSNRGGWQLPLDLENDKHTKMIFDEWLQKIQPFVLGFSNTIGINEMVPLRLSGIWVNINRKGQYNVSHIHPFSYISSVFYVKVPKSAENAGSLVIESPIEEKLYFYLPRTHDNSNSDVVTNNYTRPSYEIIPKENEVLMFTSNLKHYVTPNLTDEDRISIAFNISN